MPNRRRLILALVWMLPLWLLTPDPGAADWHVWYVATTGNNAWDCLTPSTPCLTIQAAINKALDGDALNVAAGTYSTATNGESFPIILNKMLMIHGAATATTVIDAASCGQDVIVDHNKGVYIDHFTIQGGNRGIWLNGYYPAVITGSIEDNKLTGNQTGIYSYSTQVWITRNDISGNVHLGVYNDHSTTYMQRNVFGFNGSGGADAAIFNERSDGTIVNNVIGWNDGSGIYNYQSSPTITNNTISINFGGNGIANLNSSHSTATNNIVTSNAVYGIYADAFSTPTNTYNDVWGNAFGQYYGTSGGTGSISADPRFVSLFDAHLLCSSPAINSGSNAAPNVPSVDYAGDPRPVGGTVDMGSYEWQSLLRCPGYLPIVLR